MNTQNINKNTAGASRTGQQSSRRRGTPRNLAPGVISFVVTLTTFEDVRSYPCRSMGSASGLAQRFVAGITKPRPASRACGTEPTNDQPALDLLAPAAP